MKSQFTILFRVDGDETLGLGHMSRCRSLMAAFGETADCSFAVATRNAEHAAKALGAGDFEVIEPHNLKGNYDIAVTDVPNLAAIEQSRIRNLSHIMICIDDEGPGSSTADILIRPNLLYLPRPAGFQASHYWSGKQYIILHPDFMKMTARKTDMAAPLQRLLVCFGGSDPMGLTLRIVPVLQQLDLCIDTVLVVGAAFRRKKELLDEVAGDPQMRVIYNAPNMAALFRSSDMALISGGTLLYEACCLGIPSMVISQNTGQHREAVILHQKGAAINLGLGSTVSDAAIVSALQKLIESDDVRTALSRQGPKTVLPDGAYWIARRILLGIA